MTDARDELAADRQFERRLLWKGAAAVLVVLVVVIIRQLFLV